MPIFADDLEAARGEIRDFGAWKYFMCEAPDGVLLELFEVDADALSGGAAAYFADVSHIG